MMVNDGCGDGVVIVPSSVTTEVHVRVSVPSCLDTLLRCTLKAVH